RHFSANVGRVAPRSRLGVLGGWRAATHRHFSANVGRVATWVGSLLANVGRVAPWLGSPPPNVGRVAPTWLGSRLGVLGGWRAATHRHFSANVGRVAP